MKFGSIEGIEAPVAKLVMGSMICNTDNMELTRALLDAYVAAGGNCIDTAYVYGGGKSEPAIGQWFRERDNREKIVLLDKGAHPDQNGSRVHSQGIQEDIAVSLDRLQTDHIDIYLLHRDDPDYPVGKIVETLNAEKHAGRVRVFGGSNWTTDRIQAANDYAATHGLQGFAASSPHLSLAKQNEAMWGGCLAVSPRDAQWHTDHQFPLFPWSSQAGGFFTGRYSPEKQDNADMVRVYYNDDNWKRLDRARELGAQHGVSANVIALAYVLHQPYPVFALIGPRTVDELNASLPALDVSLSEAEMRYLDLRQTTL